MFTNITVKSCHCQIKYKTRRKEKLAKEKQKIADFFLSEIFF